MKKFIATVINMISAIIVIATLCILQSKFPQDDILAILSSPVFEKTADFTWCGSAYVRFRGGGLWQCGLCKAGFRQ